MSGHGGLPARAVVVGVDGSSHAEHALAWAADDAARRHLPLTLLYAQDPFSTAEAVWTTSHGLDAVQLQRDVDRAAEEVLDRAVQTVRVRRPDVAVTTVHPRSDARQALLAASERAESIVVGSRGRGPVARLLLGSVSTAVVKHASCPVTVVRATDADHPGLGVLVGVDGRGPEPAVLEAAYAQAAARRSPLTVMHCFLDVRGRAHASRRVPDDDVSVEDVRLLVAEAVAGMAERYPDVDVRPELARGFAEQLLSRESARYDLVVVGHHRASGLSALYHGSVATAVAELAAAPVLVVPLDHAPER